MACHERRGGAGIETGEVQGLGEVLHKLSSSMDAISAKVDRQAVILEAQTAAIKRLEAPKAVPPGQTQAASPAALRSSRLEARVGALKNRKSAANVRIDTGSPLEESRLPSHSPVSQPQVNHEADVSLRTSFGAALQGKAMIDPVDQALRANGRRQLLHMLSGSSPSTSSPPRAVPGPDPNVSTRRSSRSRISSHSVKASEAPRRLDAGGPSTYGGEKNEQGSEKARLARDRGEVAEVTIGSRPVLISGCLVGDTEGGDRGGTGEGRVQMYRSRRRSIH